MHRSVMPDAVANAPGIRHAVTPAVVVQRRSVSRCLLGPACCAAHGPAHIAPPAWVCRSRPSAAPPAVQARQPQPQTLPLLRRSRAGLSAWLRWGGRALSAANAGIIGAPSSPRFQRVRGFCFLVVRHLPASATRHEPPRPCTVAARAPVASSLRRDPPPCRVPPKPAAPCSAALHIERIGLDRRMLTNAPATPSQ